MTVIDVAEETNTHTISNSETEEQSSALSQAFASPVQDPNPAESGAATSVKVGNQDLESSPSPQSRRMRPRLRPTPVRARTQGQFQVHESWEGVVEEIFSTYFVAQLVSRTMATQAEIAEILLEEVSPGDRELLVEGAVFYWAIGYRDSPSGQRTRTSVLRFRRLPQLQKGETDTWVDSVCEAWLKSS